MLSCPSPHFQIRKRRFKGRDSCSRSQLTGGSGAQTKTQELFNSYTRIPFFLFGQQPGVPAKAA